MRSVFPLFATALLLAAGAPAAAPPKPHEDPAKLAHWAFRAPVRPALPAAVPDVGHPVDAFVRTRLAAEGLKPAPDADRVTLLRRLHLDLIGLPPAPSAVDAFVNDPAPDAFERAVDALLASPHFGERWGRHWLDAARYADSDGFEKDKPRIAHFYRDWVIAAFNRDLPHDRFLTEQLAGDLLPDADQQTRVATGFLRNSLLNEEGGVDPEQFRTEALFDRMEAIGKAVLGLTIQCAQCHDHKYDPISQRDYYQLFAFINSDHEAQPVVYTPDEAMRRSDILRRTEEIEESLRARMPDWKARMAAWEAKVAAGTGTVWHPVVPEWDADSTGGQKYLSQPDGSIRAAGYQPTKHTARGSGTTALRRIGAVRIECLTDPELPARGPGRSHLGTFGLTEVIMDAGTGKRQLVKFTRAVSDIGPPPDTAVPAAFNEKKPVRRVIGQAAYAIDGDGATAWSNDIGPGRRNRSCEIVLLPEQPITADDAGTPISWTIRLQQNHGGWNSDDLMGNNLGRFRISFAESCPDPDHHAVPRHVREAIAVPREARTSEQQRSIFSHWRTTVTAWAAENAAIDAVWAGHPEGATQMVLEAMAQPRETRLFKRGDWLKPGDAVPPGVPAALHPLSPDAGSGRLAFARWVTDRRAPTTARAWVNRVWQHLFGTGLLETSEDFGVQAPAPSHPELLDWLACEFMDGGWSTKRLIRLIVTSQTWRQASAIDAAALTRDPMNRLLARGARFRVEGEIVRDIQLAASGLLDPTMGGRSLMPPAPAFLFQPPASYAPFPWREETGSQRYRRAIYTWRRRSTPYPMLAAFDTPDGATSCVRRTRSNTPVQALTALNEDIALDAARGLARRMAVAGSDDATRLTAGFRFVCARVPAPDELATLTAFLERTRARLAAGTLHPWHLASGEVERPPGALPDGLTARDLTALTAAARVLLNLDEAVTRE